ncbi:hypothetical protein BLS_007249 [Venturia inaequalis]|uniref:Rhodopsin domain-containing protein n=1 Tax=Venturia inaequalis TaxID=5025 RepID=A0A8H3ZAK2_VENIN|nr:hypothetical protein EG328_008589 [Venturia inaequalis]KAE9981557.1 hypothetical protein BLS_007249 [Venturia inaequalis]KAE9991809.1 hypothetical protein EG327_010910 [Venturia inaequalis]RDI84363.1 hypothetical protein Vi05172_g5601 [Venturia inaequalis]
MATPVGGKGLDTSFTAFKIPLRAVAKWPTPNYTHPQRRTWFIPYSVTLFLLATLVVLARLWTRVHKKAGGYGWDDSFILGSWLSAGGVTAVGIYGVHSAGLDRHVWDLLPEECVKSGLMAWAIEILFLACLSLTKISVLIFFRRLIDRSHSPWISKSIWAAIAFTVAYFFSFLLFLLFACDPTDATWKSLDIGWTGKYKCADRHVVDPLNGVFSVFSDAYSIIIPVLVVSRLSMPANRKVVLYFIFCCGLIVLGAGIARTVWLSRLYTDPQRDLTWVGYDLLVWGTLEIQMALICASAPAMRGFFSGISKTVTNRYGTKTRITDHSNSYALASKNTIARARDGEANLIQRDGQFIPLDETLRDEYPRTHDSNSWDWRQGEAKSDLEARYIEDPYYRGNWADSELRSQSDAAWTANREAKSSDELLNSPGRKARVQDGEILITETFSVERGGDPYAKERKALGL